MAASPEPNGNDLVDIDTHQGSGTFVLGTGAHGASGFCPVDKECQTDHDNQTGGNRDKCQIRNGKTAECERAG